MGLSAWTKVSAVNAFVRSMDRSHGQTNHHATRPKTTKEKKVWIPKIANASTGASVLAKRAEPTPGVEALAAVSPLKESIHRPALLATIGINRRSGFSGFKDHTAHNERGDDPESERNLPARRSAPPQLAFADRPDKGERRNDRHAKPPMIHTGRLGAEEKP